MRKITISIDESGTLPDPNDKVVIIAAIGIDNLAQIAEVQKSIRKSLKNRSKSIDEIKFYLAGEKTKIDSGQCFMVLHWKISPILSVDKRKNYQ